MKRKYSIEFLLLSFSFFFWKFSSRFQAFECYNEQQHLSFLFIFHNSAFILCLLRNRINILALIAFRHSCFHLLGVEVFFFSFSSLCGHFKSAEIVRDFAVNEPQLMMMKKKHLQYLKCSYSTTGINTMKEMKKETVEFVN